MFSLCNHIILECMIADKENWFLQSETSNLDDCNQSCSEGTEQWQWFVVTNGNCYCLDIITTGN